jgi:hypothetical protein
VITRFQFQDNDATVLGDGAVREFERYTAGEPAGVHPRV